MTDHTTDLDEVEPKPWLDSIEGCLKELNDTVNDSTHGIHSDNAQDRFIAYGRIAFIVGRLQWLDASRTLPNSWQTDAPARRITVLR